MQETALTPLAPFVVPSPRTAQEVNSRVKDDNVETRYVGEKYKVVSTPCPLPVYNVALLMKMVHLFVKLATNFPESSDLLIHQALNISEQRRWNEKSTSLLEGVHVFVDHSNILINFFDVFKRNHQAYTQKHGGRHALSFYRLSMILERGRACAKRVLAGSTKSSYSVKEARRAGNREHQYARDVQPRTRTEQGVDEILHLKMLESLLDFAPSTLVLATGDGNTSEFSTSFSAIVQRYL